MSSSASMLEFCCGSLDPLSLLGLVLLTRLLPLSPCHRGHTHLLTRTHRIGALMPPFSFFISASSCFTFLALYVLYHATCCRLFPPTGPFKLRHTPSSDSESGYKARTNGPEGSPKKRGGSTKSGLSTTRRTSLMTERASRRTYGGRRKRRWSGLLRPRPESTLVSIPLKTLGTQILCTAFMTICGT